MILRSRAEQCVFYHGEDKHLCDNLWKTYEDAAVAWFIKCKCASVMRDTKVIRKIWPKLFFTNERKSLLHQLLSIFTQVTLSLKLYEDFILR